MIKLDHSPSSEPSTPTSPSPGHPNTPENLDPDLKAYLMMMVEDIKKDFNKSLKEIQENTAKEVQVLKEKQENTIKQVEVLTEKEEKTYKQVMEMNKTILDLKREVDRIKETQSEATLEIEALGKKYGIIDGSISNRIQEMEEGYVHITSYKYSVYSQVRLSPRICLRESISTPFNRLFRQPAGLSLLRLHVTP